MSSQAQADSRFDEKMEEARKRVQLMDESDGYKDRGIGTVISALECGIKAPATDASYDALVMLLDIRKTAPGEAI